MVRLSVPRKFENRMQFSIEAYKNLLEVIIKENFVISTDVNVTTKEMLLRHDIDFDLELAHQMAIIENSLGIKSVYLVMIQNPLYDLFNALSKKCIDKIHLLGHEIGLHYDPSISTKYDFNDQFSKLDSLLGYESKFYSHHQPTLYGFNNILDYGKKIDMNSLSNNFEYISDSCMKPRKDLLKVINSQSKVHLLIHPEFWMLNSLDLYDFGLKLKNFKLNKLNENVDSVISVMVTTLANRDKLDARNSQL
jgi:hypothetical protein